MNNGISAVGKGAMFSVIDLSFKLNSGFNADLVLARLSTTTVLVASERLLILSEVTLLS